ncbi:hypothetical protein N7488_005732 [Penicillium malachiteum]|nr:hypothetical protein N7488_005732 [Penicillium malachiteum]
MDAAAWKIDEADGGSGQGLVRPSEEWIFQAEWNIDQAEDESGQARPMMDEAKWKMDLSSQVDEGLGRVEDRSGQAKDG